jgi:predicted transcriptional regulator
VERTDSERGYLYSPVVPETAARKSALSEIVRVFFNGSSAGAASALLGMSDKLSADELNDLEAMIAKARQAKGGK